MRVRTAACAGFVAAAVWAGCSTGDNASSGNNGGSSAGGAGGSAGDSSVTGGTSGDGGSAGSATGGSATGGSATGGSLNDGGLPDVEFVYDGPQGTGGVTQDSACASTSVEGSLESAPADIIFVVDTSGSMDQEAQWTQQQMPNLVSTISGSGIDTHLILISSTDMCIPPPLGSGACGGGDTNPPNFLHVVVGVGSNDALNKIISTFPQWQSMLRANSVKSFVVVSDDDATDGPYNSASAFTTAVNALNPALIKPGWKFHGIVASGGFFSPPCGPFPPLSAAEGKVYKDLINQTSGVFGDLCLQNFGPVFTQLATSVVNSAPLACEIAMPTTDAGIINPAQVQLELTLPPSPPQLLSNVGTAAGCGSGGWYYDNATNPTQLILCPETCQVANTVTNPKVNVLLGCLGS
jgi:hypothetical protein